MPSEPTRIEQYTDGYGRIRLAVAFDYDENRTRRMSSLFDQLDWDQFHQSPDDNYEFRDGHSEFAWTLDRSSESRRRLRETVGIGLPPNEELPWNIDVYQCAPGDDPRECVGCRESAVLGDKGLRACNMHHAPEFEILTSEVTSAEQVCTACGQYFEYVVHERETDAPDGPITPSTAASEVM